MKISRRSVRLFVPALIVGASVLAGCASTRKATSPTLVDNDTPAPAVDLKALNAAEAPNQPRIVTKDYATVQVTGSLIPTRVPTDTNARPLPGANPVRTMSPEEFERIVTRGLADRH
jgi:hypothetical protein